MGSLRPGLPLSEIFEWTEGFAPLSHGLLTGWKRLYRSELIPPYVFNLKAGLPFQFCIQFWSEFKTKFTFLQEWWGYKSLKSFCGICYKITSELCFKTCQISQCRIVSHNVLLWCGSKLRGKAPLLPWWNCHLCEVFLTQWPVRTVSLRREVKPRVQKPSAIPAVSRPDGSDNVPQRVNRNAVMCSMVARGWRRERRALKVQEKEGKGPLFLLREKAAVM